MKLKVIIIIILVDYYFCAVIPPTILPFPSTPIDFALLWFGLA